MRERGNARTDEGLDKASAAMTRRDFVKAGALGAAGAVALVQSALGENALAAPAIARNKRPNFLFINVDQLSCEAIAAHGCAGLRTPNIDRLIKRGVTFLRSYSADPVCCPARSAWFTGRMSSETGVVLNSLPILSDMPDLGQWLGKEGYECVYAGKWHVPNRDVQTSFHFLHGGHGVGEIGDGSTARAAEGCLLNRGAAAKSGNGGGKPFFLTVGLLNPHDICFWPAINGKAGQFPYPSLAAQAPPLPPNFQVSFDEPALMKRLKRAGPYPSWPEETWRYYEWAYYRYAEMMDGWVGRILDALEDSGLAANTIVILSADHGDGHARHKLAMKSILYDEAVRVPFVVSCPGLLPEGVVDERLVSGVDLAPTLCDFAGAAAPPKARGRSLRPILEGRSTQWREFVEAQSAVEGRMIRTPRYKLIAYRNDPTVQLFDMEKDPWETKNLAVESASAPVLEDHRKLLRDWEAALEPAPASRIGFNEAQKLASKSKNQVKGKGKAKG